ncbi:MAG TPA: hypothetical protein VEF71_26310 [Streptosporangiaceae bacterium]|nr:hypothetical protein [Streptosporangiaceae bacterium]
MVAYNPLNMTRLTIAVNKAPSILNTKPWKVDQVADDRIELRPDWTRHLEVIDPRHRELLISCGAALFNLRMAIRTTGHDLVVCLLPDRQTGGAMRCQHCGEPCGVGDLLASIEIVTRRAHPATIAEQRLYEAIPQRHTVREPFTDTVPMKLLTELERAAQTEGADARLVHRRDARRLLRGIAGVNKKLALDPLYLAELDKWAGGCSGGIGIPHTAFGPKPTSQRRPPVRDLGLNYPDRHHEKFERHPRMIVLETKTDAPSDWIRAGQALERLLLTATRYGIDTSFLTQQLELEDRKILHPQLANQWWPWPEPAQMVIRVGARQAMSIRDLTR